MWDVFSNNKDTEIKDEVKSNLVYSTNSNVFIGSILGYITLENWNQQDKGKLYLYEITHKASDDAERYKEKHPLC